MDLFLMRHGEASFQAPSDALRPLTEAGAAQSQRMSQYLATQVRQLDVVFVSPYLRAIQTWQACEPGLPQAGQLISLQDLVPEANPPQTHDVVNAYMDSLKANTALVVAHMPLLSYLITEWVPGVEPPIFAPSSIAHIQFRPESSLISMKSPQDLTQIL